MQVIDVASAKEYVQANYPNDPLLKAMAGTLLETMPMIEAEPVVFGHWIDRVDNDTPMHECSVCGARVVKGLYEYENPNIYCYHCGAKMNEGRKSHVKEN